LRITMMRKIVVVVVVIIIGIVFYIDIYNIFL